MAQEDRLCLQQQLAQGVTQRVARDVDQKPFQPDMLVTRSRSLKSQHMIKNEEDILNLVPRNVQKKLPQELAQFVAQEDSSTCFGRYQPNQKGLSHETTWSTISIREMLVETWNRIKINLGLEVIQFLNQRIFGLPYLEPYGIMRLQTYHWRPGEIIKHLRKLSSNLPSTSTHKIRRIFKFTHLPYLDAFTLGPINHQRLYHLCSDLDVIIANQNVPEKLTYPLKPSRYKQGNKFP